VTFQEAGHRQFAIEVMAAAQQAGAAIMDIYRTKPEVRFKADNSPVTDADHAAEEIVIAALARLMPGVAVIAEEQVAAGRIPAAGSDFFLVDPLDGTKEFLKFNGEFTVNIARVREGKAIFGLIYAPAKSDCYLTLDPGRAFRCALHPAHTPAQGSSYGFVPLDGERTGGRPFTAITSRSHPRPEAAAFLERLGNPARVALGSSLKFCMLARGEADVYPRFGPTSEWDTAAGQAILEAAGGSVLTADGEPLTYGKRERSFVNSGFIAWRRPPDGAAKI
jgi:3'(2'), 5'-bisphosphate nucleotidase